VLPDLLDAGLRSATLLHVLEAGRGEPDAFLEDVGTWARRFEAAGLAKVSVALKRGDPSAWVRELSAMNPGQWVIAATPQATPEGFLRPASAWRNLAVPVLLLPPAGPQRPPPLFERVLVALKDPLTARPDVDALVRAFPQVRHWRGLHVKTDTSTLTTDYPIAVTTLEGDRYDIADNLLAAAGESASLLVLFARPQGLDPHLPAGYVSEAVVRGAVIPVLLWPGKEET
jgi:hypothetical protein